MSVTTNSNDARVKRPGPGRPGAGAAPAVAPDSSVTLCPPLLGLAGVMVGTVCAVLTTPEEYGAEGALRLPAALLCIGLALGPLWQMLRTPKSLLRAEHVLVMSPIFWLLLDLLQGRYTFETVRREDVIQAFLAMGVFAGAIWLSAFRRVWRMPSLVSRAVAQELSPNIYFVIGLVAFGLAFLRFAIPSEFDLALMWEGITGSRWAAPWSRGAMGGTDAILDHFAYFGYVLPLLAVVLGRRVGWLDPRTWLMVVLALIIAAFLAQGGGRRIIGVLFGSAAVFWFLSRREVRWPTLLGLGAAGLVLLLVMETMLDYRNVGLGALLDPEMRQEVAAEVRDTSTIRVDDNFLRLAQMTIIFPDYHPHTTWRYFLWVAVRPVPRVLWAGKPVDPGFDLPEFLGYEGITLSMSVIGELFMAGGFIAILFGGWFYGRLAGMLSGLLSGGAGAGALVVYSAGLLALFAGMRSMIELVLMSYMILAWLGLLIAARPLFRS